MSDNTCIDPRELRNALGHFATGVTIVTTAGKDGVPVGLTVNSFSSVSLEPPLVLWSLAKTANSLSAFRENRYFTIHILGEHQVNLSNRFASAGSDKFANLEYETGPGNVPLLDGCAARFQCRLSSEYEGGDHMIFVGEVLEFEESGEAPLVFHRGRYATAKTRLSSLSDSDHISQSGFDEDFLLYLIPRVHFQLYRPVLHAMARAGISEPANFLFSVLIVSGRLSRDDVNQVLAHTGHEIEQAVVDQVIEQELVTADSDEVNGKTPLTLTAAGRNRALRILSACKAVEEDAFSGLEESEVRAFKNVLRHIMKRTDPGVPDFGIPGPATPPPALDSSWTWW